MSLYLNKAYLTEPRLMAYLEQFKYVEDNQNVLEVGSGAGVFGELVKRVASYTSIDIDKATSPDVVGDITNWADIEHFRGQFDVIFCCQVLEHIPFDASIIALKNLLRLNAKRIVISIPDNRKAVQVLFNIRRFQIKKLITVPGTGTDINITNNDQHHWEVWSKNYKEIYATYENIDPEYRVVKRYRCYDRFKQHFFVYEKAV